jgi:hypothetical protein
MNEREAFKFGFMARCVQAGLRSPQQIKQAVDKAGGLESLKGLISPEAASTVAGAAAGNVINQPVGGALAGLLGTNWALPLALAAPPLVGYAAGNLAARASNVDEFDPEEAKRQELIDEYTTQADRVRRRSLINKLQAARQPSRSPYM